LRKAQKEYLAAERVDKRARFFGNVMARRADVLERGVIHALYRSDLAGARAEKYKGKMEKAIGWQLYLYGVSASRSNLNPIRMLATALAKIMAWRANENAVKYGRNSAASRILERAAYKLISGGEKTYLAKARLPSARAKKTYMLGERFEALLARQVPTTARNAISIFEELVKNHSLLKMAYIDYRQKLASEAARLLKAAKDAKALAEKMSKPRSEIIKAEEKIKIYENAINEIKSLAPPSEFVSRIRALGDKVESLYSEFLDGSTSLEKQNKIANEIEFLRATALELSRLNKGLVYGVTVKHGKVLLEKPQIIENMSKVIELLNLRRAT
jgi:hypothetical protein